MKTLTEARQILEKYNPDLIQTFSYGTQRHARLVAKQLHQLIRDSELAGKVTVSVKDGVIYIGKKQKKYIDELCAVIQDMLLYIDDAELFERAHELVSRRYK